MDVPARPELRCLVAYVTPPFGVMTEPHLVSLEDAVTYKALGYCVLVDPQDAEDLARWEQIQRSVRPARKWYERH